MSETPAETPAESEAPAEAPTDTAPEASTDASTGATTDPATAGEQAAQRSPEEQAQVLADAPALTDEQRAQVAENAGAGAPVAPDHTAGTDAGGLAGVGPADPEDRSRPDLAEGPSDVDVDQLGTNVVRHAHQQVGVTSASAAAVRAALNLTPGTEWDRSLDDAIRAFQKEIGQDETGYLTRDQCRRLGLAYLV